MKEAEPTISEQGMPGEEKGTGEGVVPAGREEVPTGIGREEKNDGQREVEMGAACVKPSCTVVSG